jgi:thiosulfate dehydrogenase [quinone] large subunit
VGVTLYVIGMNQVHHGGVWGNLHNYSKKPDIQLSDLQLSKEGDFQFTAYRDKGPEAYGTFVIKVSLVNAKGETVHTFGQDVLANLPQTQIDNEFVNKIQPGEHSLEVPLGARGSLAFSLPDASGLEAGQAYRVTMTEAGGRTYRTDLLRL